MPDADLPQAEANRLIALPKHRVNLQAWPYPRGGGRVAIPLQSENKREHFLLDLSRAGINITKGTHQTRARQVEPLVRLCTSRPGHRNPDGVMVPPDHLHLYREGYAAKWAQPVPADVFRDLADLQATLEDFMRYCNVVEPPFIQARWIP